MINTQGGAVVVNFLKVVVLFVAFVSQSLHAGEEQSDNVRQKLNAMFPVSSVKYVSEIGLFQVELSNGTILFSNDKADNFVVGELYSMDPKSNGNRPINVTEQEKDKLRVEAVRSLDKKDLVIFPAKGETTGSMYVFTDVDCSYCRRLHSEMDTYNSNGIEVRYISWPRCGTNCISYEKAVAVWCSDDPQAAMSLAKSGAMPEPKTCDNPVKEQHDLAVRLGLRGTPFIILDDGRTIPGYKPAAEIVEMLNQS